MLAIFQPVKSTDRSADRLLIFTLVAQYKTNGENMLDFFIVARTLEEGP